MESVIDFLGMPETATTTEVVIVCVSLSVLATYSLLGIYVSIACIKIKGE